MSLEKNQKIQTSNRKNTSTAPRNPLGRFWLSLSPSVEEFSSPIAFLGTLKNNGVTLIFAGNKNSSLVKCQNFNILLCLRLPPSSPSFLSLRFHQIHFRLGTHHGDGDGDGVWSVPHYRPPALLPHSLVVSRPSGIGEGGQCKGAGKNSLTWYRCNLEWVPSGLWLMSSLNSSSSLHASVSSLPIPTGDFGWKPLDMGHVFYG